MGVYLSAFTPFILIVFHINDYYYKQFMLIMIYYSLHKYMIGFYITKYVIALLRRNFPFKDSVVQLHLNYDPVVTAIFKRCP